MWTGTRGFEALGYHVLRFWNSDVLMDMSAVAGAILAVREVPPHPALSPAGGEE
jgi:very-short-patch-repair endonuclease